MTENAPAARLRPTDKFFLWMLVPFLTVVGQSASASGSWLSYLLAGIGAGTGYTVMQCIRVALGDPLPEPWLQRALRSRRGGEG